MSNRRKFLKDLAGTAAGILFVRCGLLETAAASPQTSARGKRREVVIGGRRVLTVDIHAHFYPPQVWDLIKDFKEAEEARGFAVNRSALDPANAAGRLKLMDEMGVDIEAVSLAPAFSYWAERDLARRIVQIQNDKIAEMCASHPDRFVGLGALALQHPDLAVEQMEHGVKKLDMRGFEIGGSVNGVELAAPKFHPVWAKAEELGVLIFIHPRGFPEGEPRFQGNGWLTNVIGNPLETTVALSHFIFDGTLDRFPGLKICAAHGGGYLPSYIGRSDYCVTNNSQVCKPVGKYPREYFKQLYIDSLVYTAEGVRHLASVVGASNILLGSDVVTPMGYSLAVDDVLNAPGLSDSEREAILGGNAAKLLRIQKEK